jgi:hypothetical protein
MFMLHLDAPLVNIPNGAGGLVVLYVVDDMFFCFGVSWLSVAGE